VEYDYKSVKDFEAWPLSSQKWITRSTAHHEIHPTIMKYMRRAMANEDIHVATCCTEMDVSGVGIIRSHPNYQSDGPWEDWVMITQMHRRQVQNVPAMVCLFITAFDDHVLDVPMAVIRRCNLSSKKDDNNFPSMLFERHSKAYTSVGEPFFDLVYANEIKELRLVFEDTPVLMDMKDQWRRSMDNQLWLEDEPPTLHEGIKPVLCEWKTPEVTAAFGDAVEKDWVCVTRPFIEWMEAFTSATDHLYGSTVTEAFTSATGHR
jgi:hypothetical protein